MDHQILDAVQRLQSAADRVSAAAASLAAEVQDLARQSAELTGQVLESQQLAGDATQRQQAGEMRRQYGLASVLQLRERLATARERASAAAAAEGHAEARREAAQADLDEARSALADARVRLAAGEDERDRLARSQVGGEAGLDDRRERELKLELLSETERIARLQALAEDTSIHAEAAAEARVSAADRSRAAHHEVTDLEAELSQARQQLLAPPAEDDVPVRDLVLQALGELAVPASSAELARYLQVRFGREVATNRFGPLRRDEERAYATSVRGGRKRPVWLVPALTRTGAAERGRWARSDWAVERRIGVPTWRSVQRTGELALHPPPGCHNPEELYDLAVELLGAIEPPPSTGSSVQWLEHALEVLPLRMVEREPDSAQVRRIAERLGTHEQLFGIDHTIDLDATPDTEPEDGTRRADR